MDLLYADLASLRRALDAGMVSAVELAQDHLRAIDRDAATPLGLGAVLSTDSDVTLAAARAAQTRLDRGEVSPLLGIPVLHKDIFVTTGWPTTAASKILQGYRSPFDAEVVSRLADAGMVGLGKTNCDEFAMGSATQHSAYGPCRNPWDRSRIPGGSSGGSAAAVAAGLAPAATGTDTGGSVRQPAAMCGITGLKPTYGRISRWGMIAYASSLDQAGPMARTSLDCGLMLNAMAGFDPKDATSLERPSEDFTRLVGAPTQDAPAAQPLKGLRVGLPTEFFGDGLHAEVRGSIDAALAVFRGLGAVTVEVSLPRTELSIPTYYVIAPAEASSNLSRFDGVRYGHRADQPKDLDDLYRRSRTEGFGEEVQRRILVGTFVLSHGYYDAYYLQAQRVRRLIAQDFDRAFEGCDFILGPVSPRLAWRIDEMDAQDPLAEFLADIYTLGASLAGLPGMSLPCGFGNVDGACLPVGLQLIGPRFEEARLIAVGHAFQQATDWHQRHPPAGVAT